MLISSYFVSLLSLFPVLLVDTRYVTRSGTRRHLSFKVHHASRISIACMKYNAKGIKREAGFVASRASVAARLAVVHEAHPA